MSERKKTKAAIDIVSRSIITIGLSPAWDIECRVAAIRWGMHKVVSSRQAVPAGKAMNISAALGWMRTKSTAAGLWGRDDYRQMIKATSPLKKFVRIRMTTVEGSSRQNITIIDAANNKQMHLRDKSLLASAAAVRKLRAAVSGLIEPGDICAFAGAMPQGQPLRELAGLIDFCRRRGAKVAVDTSGEPLRKLVGLDGIWLVKPNLEELRELLTERIRDNPVSLARAGLKLLDRVEIVLISRGEKGAVLVTKNGCWKARCQCEREKVLSTVGCGDYLLAGFLKEWKEKSSPGFALETAVKAATAKAWDWTQTKKWAAVRRRIKVQLDRL